MDESKESYGPAADDQAMTLVSVRIPDSDLAALRLAALATRGSVAHEIRLGIQMRLGELRKDPDFIDEVKSKRDALSRLVDDLETDPHVERAVTEAVSGEQRAHVG